MKLTKYPEYFNTGLDWLGHIPSDWQLKRLGTVFKERREKVSDTDYPALSVTKSGIVPQLENAAKTDAGDNRKRVAVGDFVINSRSDRKGSSGLSALDGSVSLISIVLQPTGINGAYAHYLLKSQPFQEEFYRFGKGIVADLWSTNYSEMKNISLPMPDEFEQTRIAAFLYRETAKIDLLIQKQRRLIELLEEKRQAAISHVVTKGLNPNTPMKESGVEWLGKVPTHWEVKRLKHTSIIIDCKNRTPEYFDDGKYLVVRTTNVKKQKLITEGASFTDEANFKVWTQRGTPPANSILFTREAPAGEVCFVPENVPLCMGQRMMNFIPYDAQYSYFLFDFLVSDCLTRYIESESMGSTVSHLRVEQVYNIPVVIPPPEERIEIHKYLSLKKGKFERLINAAVQAIKLMQERRIALISAAVTGKIDVREVETVEMEAAV